MIRLLLVDDLALLRAGFRMVFEAHDDMVVVGEAGDGAAAVDAARRLRPDVVLMDVRMPGMDGIEATRRIVGEQAAGDGPRVLILTTFDLDDYVHAALRAGASGFLLKDALPHVLVGAVRSVAEGDAVLAPAATRRLLDRFAPHLPGGDERSTLARHERALSSLTPREREVLLEMASGHSNPEIARSLVLSEATVKTHVGRVMRKLGVRDRVQAVILAYDAGLVD